MKFLRCSSVKVGVQAASVVMEMTQICFLNSNLKVLRVVNLKQAVSLAFKEWEVSQA